MDTLLVVVLVFLNLDLHTKLPNWMTTIFVGFMHKNVVLLNTLPSHMLSKMVIKRLLKGNKKVPAGFYAVNIPLIKIKREKKLYISNPSQPNNI